MINKSIQMQCLPRFIVAIVCTVTLLSGCELTEHQSPQGYDLRKPEKMNLGKTLNEISGLSYNLNDSSLLAISDSKIKVVEIHLKGDELRDYTREMLPEGQDIEDLVNMETVLFLLSSKGVIYEIPLPGRDTVISYPFWSQDKNDFETLYYDEQANGLIMLCKSCAADKGKQTRSAYRFNLDNRQFDSTVYYSISTQEVKQLAKNDDAKFDPSAASIHPINKRLYILSSAGNLLVIADPKGKPLEAYPLNPDDHPQAEGIAFSPN
jgi:uncharacterized protein YjiK